MAVLTPLGQVVPIRLNGKCCANCSRAYGLCLRICARFHDNAVWLWDSQPLQGDLVPVGEPVDPERLAVPSGILSACFASIASSGCMP